MNLIYDETQIRRFFETVLPPVWKDTEAAFISLAARKKYVPEGMAIDLGHRPEMLDREIVKKRSADEYLAKLRRFTAEGGYLAEDGSPIPIEAMAVYVNIHLSDTVAAWRKTKEEMAKVDAELMKHAVYGGNDVSHPLRLLRNMNGIWLTAMQNSYSRKRWIDYDIDPLESDSSDLTSRMAHVFEEMGVLGQTIWIRTRGGFHVLLSTEGAPFNAALNPETILKRLQKRLEGQVKEAVINKNGMVPLPGTMQGGREVSFFDIT